MHFLNYRIYETASVVLIKYARLPKVLNQCW